MPLSSPPASWTTLLNKPSTVAGFGISDMGSQTVANATNAVSSLNAQTGAITNTTLYAIGSYVIGRPANTTAQAVNTTISGSSLWSTATLTAYGNFACAAQFGIYGTSQAISGQNLVNTGTWRCVSPAQSGGGWGFSGLWVRIS